MLIKIDEQGKRIEVKRKKWVGDDTRFLGLGLRPLGLPLCELCSIGAVIRPPEIKLRAIEPTEQENKGIDSLKDLLIWKRCVPALLTARPEGIQTVTTLRRWPEGFQAETTSIEK